MPISPIEFEVVDEGNGTDWGSFEAVPKPEAEVPVLDPETQIPQFIRGPSGIKPISLNAEQATAPILQLPRFQSQAPPAGAMPVLDPETQLPVRLEMPGGGSRPASVDPLFAATANTPITFAEGAESPLGLATLPFAGTRAGAALLRGVFGGLAAKQGAQQLGEASVTGDVQKGAEGALQLAAAPAITGFGGRAEPLTERTTNALRIRPEQEYQRVAQGADVPTKPAEVRPAESQPDSGGGGVVGGAEEQAPVSTEVTPTELPLKVSEAPPTEEGAAPIAPTPPTEPTTPTAGVPAETELEKADREANEAKEAEGKMIGERIKSGKLKPENVVVTINPPMKLGEKTVPGFVQVDEVHPTEGNVWSNKAETLRKYGFDIPSTEELLKLKMGQYRLPQIREMMKEAEKAKGETKAPVAETKPAAAETPAKPPFDPEALTEQEAKAMWDFGVYDNMGVFDVSRYEQFKKIEEGKKIIDRLERSGAMEQAEATPMPESARKRLLAKVKYLKSEGFLPEKTDIEKSLAKPTPAKEPWQMTQAEWVTHEQRGTAYKFTDEKVTEARHQEAQARRILDKAIADRNALGNPESIRKVMTDREGALKRNQARMDADKVIEEARKDFNKWASRSVGRATHEGYVKRALEAGKPVTPEVLKDYPDLAKPTTPTKPAEVAPEARKTELEATQERSALEAAEPTKATTPISEGPGAASPGDVPPPPPPTDPVTSRPPENRPNGNVTPSSPGLTLLVSGLGSKIRTLLKGMAGDSMPKTTAADHTVGEAGVRYASSHIFAPRAARLFSAQTLQGTGVDPVKFGAALVEDNLRSVREGFRADVTRLTAEGKPDQAAEAKAKADAVTSLVGVQRSPFADEDAYQDFLADPATQRAIDQHKQQWEEVVDPMFKRAQGIDPDVDLPTRGQQTGARVNLKAVLEGEPGTSVVRTGPSLTATFKRKSPFARAAKGTGKAYEVDYHELMSNTFTRQMEIANKNEFDKALVESGNAVIGKPGQQVEVKGEPGVPFPLTRRVLVGRGEPVPLAQNIYVRQSLAREYRTAANVDPSARIPVLTPILNGLNRAALAGLTDFTVHASNQMTALFNRPVSGGLISDSLLSATGRADVPVTLVKAVLKSFQNNEAQLSELAEIGALREAHTGSNPLGKILSKTDQITRLLLDDTFNRLTDNGLVDNTETARREYVNQIGQYNKRLQGPMVRLLRDTGFGPFATAGRTFNALGVKMATLSPGVKGVDSLAAAGLRANILSKWVGFAVLLGTLNYLMTKDKGGGVMGRKGVPIGNLDIGMDNKRGQPLSLPLADIMGLGRAARVTGIKGAVQAKYLGLTDSDALDAAARDIINSATGPALGPGVRGATVAATGSPPAVGVSRTAPVAPPGTSQFKVNVEEALKDANPIVKSFLDYTRGGKSLREAVSQQIPRFGLAAGKPEATAANFPKIVNRAQLNAYTDALAREVRQQPINERRQWIADRLAKDELSTENANTARVLLQRKGVLHFK